MSYRPDMAAIMRGIVHLDRIHCDRWAHTYEAWGFTAQDIEEAREAEVARRIREAEPAIHE